MSPHCDLVKGIVMDKLFGDRHEWATAIGRIFIAFGAIESVTHTCLTSWSEEPLYKHLSKMRLDQRLSLIADLASMQGLPESEVSIFVGRIKETRELAQKRNHIAHNPLVLCLFAPEGEFVPVIGSHKEEGPILEYKEVVELASQAEQLEAEFEVFLVMMRLHDIEWKPLPAKEWI